MKLRNKKTGELVDAWSFYDGNESVNLKYFTDDGQVNLEYNSLSELNEEWEDYKPVEPLIEDEKIRKALRAVYDAAPHRDNVVYFDGRWTFRGDKFEVMFDDRQIKIEGWTEGKAYHIEELCGESE